MTGNITRKHWKEMQSCRNETLQIFENLNSTENVSEPDFDISSSIDTAKELPLSKAQSSATPDVKKSKESKLVLYEIPFLDFYFSSVENGWLCKIYCSLSHGNAGNRAFVDKPRKLRSTLWQSFQIT